MLSEQKLQAISEQLSRGVVPPQESTRSFLLWFGAERRGPRIVREIRESLKKFNLKTSPDFEFAYIDGLISFEKSTDGQEVEDSGIAIADPTYRIGRLESANRAPISVKPDATLQQAVTLMLTNDFSQMPVMSGERDVKGVVSWKTIGSRLALKRPCPHVRDCMEPAHVLPINDSLFNAIKRIAETDYVLVQALDRRICGIITASDFNEQFRKLAEPFLLVGEIENGLRQMLHGKFTVAELQAAKAPGDESREISSVSDLTFGGYQRLVEAEDRWAKVQLEIDRAEFVARLDRVREIRNDVMHFDPDGLEDADLLILREFAHFLKRLRDVGAVRST
jgi:CBS domain-containing protein